MTKPECEMMFGWAGYTSAQIEAMRMKGEVCECNVLTGGVCAETGKAYFAPPVKEKENDSLVP